MKGFEFELKDKVHRALYLVSLGDWSYPMTKSFLDAGFKFIAEYKCLECVIEFENDDVWRVVLDQRSSGYICMVNIYTNDNKNRYMKGSDNFGNHWARSNKENPHVYLTYIDHYVRLHMEKIENEKQKALTFKEYKEVKGIKGVNDDLTDFLDEYVKAETPRPVLKPEYVGRTKKFLGIF